MTVIERRVMLSEVETRAAGENKRVIVGYAYKFGARSQNLGGFREQILEGAGKESLEQDDIRALKNHDANLILGRNRADTLHLEEDSTGLLYEIHADERQSYVHDLMISIERGDVTQSSFGFQVLPDGESWNYDESDFPLRSISKMSLFDVSPVTYPAYQSSEASISQRCMDMAASLTGKRDLWVPSNPPEFDSEALQIRADMARYLLRG